MPKYTNKKLTSTTIETESGTYPLEVDIDTLGYITLTFGASFNLRIDYKNIEKLQTILQEAKYKLEEDAIDQASEHLNHYVYKDPNNPANW